MHEFLLVLLQSCQIDFLLRVFTAPDKSVGPERNSSAGSQTAVSVLISRTLHKRTMTGIVAYSNR